MRICTIPLTELESPHVEHPSKNSHQVVGLYVASRILWLPGNWDKQGVTTRELDIPEKAQQGFINYLEGIAEGTVWGSCYAFGAIFDGRNDIVDWGAGAEYAHDIVAAGQLVTRVAIGQHAVYGKIIDSVDGVKVPDAAHSVVGADAFYIQQDSADGPICLVPRDASDELWATANYSLYVAAVE